MYLLAFNKAITAKFCSDDHGHVHNYIDIYNTKVQFSNRIDCSQKKLKAACLYR